MKAQLALVFILTATSAATKDHLLPKCDSWSGKVRTFVEATSSWKEVVKQPERGNFAIVERFKEIRVTIIFQATDGVQKTLSMCFDKRGKLLRSFFSARSSDWIYRDDGSAKSFYSLFGEAATPPNNDALMRPGAQSYPIYAHLDELPFAPLISNGKNAQAH